MSKVFVIDTNKHPLDPVHPGRARLLLKHGKAAVDITTRGGRVQGIHHRFCTPVQRLDGYGYAKGTKYADSPTQSSK